MIKLNILTLLATFAFGAQAAPSIAKIDCYLPGFGVLFSYDGKLTESDPNQHLEQYTMKGQIHFEDENRPHLEFKDFTAVGVFDMSRGVIRFRLRPIAPLMFNIFEAIHLTQEANGHQVVGISSFDLEHGPNGGTNGNLCTIIVK